MRHGVEYKRGDVFELTDDHLKLLTASYVQWQDCETGAAEIDPKRPYGNSAVYTDVAELLGWPTPDQDDEEAWEVIRTRAMEIHSQTVTALQIVLGCRTFKPGKYRYTASKYEREKWVAEEG